MSLLMMFKFREKRERRMSFKKIFIAISINAFFFNTAFSLNRTDAQKIGLLVWQNEASRRTDLLVFWNPKESFPSLGIGHCIWNVQGQSLPYTEQFPALCDYLLKNGVKLPEWLKKSKNSGAPWKSREDFLNDKQKTDELRNLLSTTVDLQANFMIKRLEDQWPLILNTAPKQQRAKIVRNFKLLKSSLLGTYALIDYLNFKGDGLNPLEERNGQRWGLLQVLIAMPEEITSETVTRSFALAAAQTLLQLIRNTTPEYKPIVFLNGWIKRVSTYCNPDIFKTV